MMYYIVLYHIKEIREFTYWRTYNFDLLVEKIFFINMML